VASVQPYATVDELKLEVTKVGDERDEVIGSMILAASRLIDRYCNRSRDGFVAGDPERRAYVPASNRHCWLDECVAVTQVEASRGPGSEAIVLDPALWLPARGSPDQPTFGATPYTLVVTSEPLFTPHRNFGIPGFHAWSSSWSHPQGHMTRRAAAWPSVWVTLTPGFAESVPGVVNQCCKIQVARWVRRAASSWADAIGDSVTGELRFVQRLDPDVELMLKYGRLVRPSIA
jgi:hypothetical protein